MASKGYFLMESKSIRLGESMQVGKYTLTMQDTFREEHQNYLRRGVVFAVEKNGKQVATMRPARHFYYKVGQGDPFSIESAIRPFGLNDLYIALGPLPEGYDSGELVSAQVYLNPLINVVWIGVAIITIGGIIAMGEKYQIKKSSA